MDIVVDGDSRVEHPGGSPMNVSLGLARLGMPVVFATALGDDAAGRTILDHLVDSGVEVIPGLEQGRTTSTARVTLDAGGAPEYRFDVDWSLSLEGHLPPHPVHVHTGSIGAFLSPGAATVAEVVHAARPTATISFDPNIRPQFLPSLADAVAAVEAHVAASDVVKASDEDVAWLYPGAALDEVAAAWLALGPALVIITRGGGGALAHTRATSSTAPAHSVTVVDSIGAGDAFMSGIIAGMHARGLTGPTGRARLAELGGDDLAELLALGMMCGAITVSRAGAQPPRRDEIPADVFRF